MDQHSFGFLKTEKVYSILELNNTVKKLIRMDFPDYVWVCGEIQDLRDRGTVNLNLVQKHPEANEIMAQVNAVIFENIKPQITKRIAETNGAFELKKDIEVKLLCKVDLYVKTGKFSLTVFDIDTVYTLGKMAQSRQRIIEELKAKGLLERNKLIPMPSIPLKVGLITAPDSAAYHDVLDEFKKSQYGFKIFIYGCYMQGKLVESDVTAALNFFNNLSRDELDVIVIARGGGSTADLSWFDNKKIAETVAMLKFPLISAIGHEINTSITDMVAHTFVKTPTKGAQFIIERVKEFIGSLESIEQRMELAVKDFLENNKNQLAMLTSKCDSGASRYFQIHKEELSLKKANIGNFTKKFLSMRRQELLGSCDIFKLKLNTFLSDSRESMKHIESKVRLLDPKNVLKRGYSITFKDSKPIKSIDDIDENDIIKTVLYKGDITSRVEKKQKENEQENNKI
ncbi:MAG: exodeoxyribonuclease VII large subunit [Candidatus Omnitrophica bacterium]|jgi:exodeoxyribonuclease VII large subunit|nr:exodeoxyribonuclease VII large subunit [Candidatus Omnitrophota bacterium]